MVECISLRNGMVWEEVSGRIDKESILLIGTIGQRAGRTPDCTFFHVNLTYHNAHYLRPNLLSLAY